MTAAATAEAASSSLLLKPSLLRFPNRLLPSSSLPFLSLHLSAAFSISVPITLSHCHHPLSALPLPSFPRLNKAFAIGRGKENTAVATAEKEKVEDGGDGWVAEEANSPVQKPCELYVCNLPRSCDISQLLDLFQPYGTVHSVEVSRDIKTGLSRGCGFVMMSSMQEAKAAIVALDGSDLGGREMRVKFSADMGPGGRYMQALNAPPKKNMVFESPYRVYVGNLAWSVKPEDLKEYFSQYGTVVSVKMLIDRKGGRKRAYGFVSFTSDDEVKAAMVINGLEFHGRPLVLREIAINSEDI